MIFRFARAVAAVAGASVATAASAVVAPAISTAAECGPGTVYDPPTNMCVVAPVAPAQWNAPPPPALPPVSICPPIPFVAVCFPVN